MGKYGYIGKDKPTQAVKANSGLFSVNEHKDLLDQDKLISLGQLELIQTQVYSSGVASVDFTDIKEDTYNMHFMTMNNMQSADDNVEVTQIQFYENLNGTSTLFTSSNYEFARENMSSSSYGESYTTSADDFQVCAGSGNATNEKQSAYIYFYNLGDDRKYSGLSWMAGMWSSDPYYFTTFGAGQIARLNIVDGIRVKTSSGNFASFEMSLYGIRYS